VTPDLSGINVRCGSCGSDDVRMLACPQHEWAFAGVCHGCMHMALHENVGWDGEPNQDCENEYGEGHCPECGYPGLGGDPETSTT
jgi:hypothetical protein